MLVQVDLFLVDVRVIDVPGEVDVVGCVSPALKLDRAPLHVNLFEGDQVWSVSSVLPKLSYLNSNFRNYFGFGFVKQ